ncbi:uncharacterized protein LOC125945558 [Dermacentor silvarum]|uniref:uncharacterized protein LOC125945558 n=1 Tax=Dermacentor silvarum TaxID=543639 RepID=UPI002101A655|nr:uncharacterized protein LOC125945558 [Dermacentor silvarum]
MSFEVLRLHANQEAHALDTQLIDNHAASNAKELFLTNCILADPDDLYRSVRSCSELQALRCVASTLRPCDLLTLMLKRLPHLMEVELSLVSETGVAWETGNMEEIASQNPDAKAYNLCLMYVEIGGTQNLQLLKVLLNFCPNLTRLHVHFVSGNLGKAIAECRCILEARPRLKTFTFSSEMTPTSIEFRPVGPLGFSSYANFCANVTYQRSPKSWSCAQLRDVAHNWKEGRTLPTQLVLVAIDDEDLMVEWIRMACHRHIWTFVRHLCLLKFPAELSSANKQTGAGATYHDTLRHFFSTAAKNVVELNVSSFHFGPDLDLTQLFLRDALKFLQSLSVSPCGLSHPLALKRLAQSCPGIEDLDLRVDRRGGLIWCSICESEFRFEAEQMRLFWRTGPYSRNQRQLARLTLCDLPKLASLQFLELLQCHYTASVQLSQSAARGLHEFGPVAR